MLPNWAWPKNPAAEPTMIQRAGRAIHWLSLLAALVLLVIGIVGLTAAYRADAAPKSIAPTAPNYFDRFDGGTEERVEETAAFKAASPETQKAIKDFRALNEAARADAVQPRGVEWDRLDPVSAQIPAPDRQKRIALEALLCLLAAAGVTVAGRAMRYVLTSE